MIVLLKNTAWSPQSSSLPNPVVLAGLSVERQWYLYNTIAEYYPETVCERVCPKPNTPLGAALTAHITSSTCHRRHLLTYQCLLISLPQLHLPLQHHQQRRLVFVASANSQATMHEAVGRKTLVNNIFTFVHVYTYKFVHVNKIVPNSS